jgi:hypothetical protein
MRMSPIEGRQRPSRWFRQGLAALDDAVNRQVQHAFVPRVPPPL